MSDDPIKEPIRSTLVEDDPSYADLVAKFVAGLDDRMRAMREALAMSDFEGLRRLAHQLKGAGGSHGYHILTKLAATLEKQALANQIEESRKAIAELVSVIRHLEVGADLPS